MASETHFGNRNHGFQAGSISGTIHSNITTQFLQSESSLNQACLQGLCTTNPYDDKDRIQNTNGGLLKESYCWILSNAEFKNWLHDEDKSLLWIKGDPGKGKTMLLCGIIDDLPKLNVHAANVSFFFCQATDARINNATAVLRGLIYMLVQKQPSLLSYVRDRYENTGKRLFEDINSWTAMLGIFRAMLQDPTFQPTIFIIDALDECLVGLFPLIDFIIQRTSDDKRSKWIVSSRNWPEIEERFRAHTAPFKALISLELNEASVSEAVTRFIKKKVHELVEVKKYDDTIRDTVSRHLFSNSQGTFLWVALVCQELGKTKLWNAVAKLNLLPPGLDALYDRMLKQIYLSEDAELCKRILATVSTVNRPITLYELRSYIDLPLADNHEAQIELIASCGSFLTLRESTIVLVHQSAKDFLLERAQNDLFPKGLQAEHRAIFSHSLQVMFSTLRCDIFNVKFPGIPIDEVQPPSPNPLAEIQYACVYWVDHLLDSSGSRKLDPAEIGDVDRFLRQKYLHWLEALSLLRSVSNGIRAMQKLETIIQKDNGDSQSLFYRAQDASRFIRYHRTAIESSPLQVYHSGPIFSPTKSLTRKAFQEERPHWILSDPVVEDSWNACLQTLEGHTDKVTSVAWSPDGSRLASASDDKTIIIWDPLTGQSISILEGHTSAVNSIVWSPDGSRLASASVDETVKIWNSVVGESLLTLEGHGYNVRSVFWSPDGSRLISVSSNELNKVIIWDPVTGERISSLGDHALSVSSIAWSPDGSRLASASQEYIFRIWNPATGQSLLTLEMQSRIIWVSWSPDGSQIISGCNNGILGIWDSNTGQSLLTLEGHSRTITSATWSPGGNWIASTSFDLNGEEHHAARIWSSASGESISILTGHSSIIVSIAWSSDGSRIATTSEDQTIRVWDPVSAQCISSLEGHSHRINATTWSPDGSQIASGSSDKTVRVWTPATDQGVSTLEGHSKALTSIAWSQDRHQFVSASSDKTLRIWDPATSRSLSILERRAILVAWSPDNSQFASVDLGETITIWDPATSRIVSILEAHTSRINSVAWSPDGSNLASTSEDNTVRIWNPVTGQAVSVLMRILDKEYSGHRGNAFSITWSPDGSRLASGSSDKIVIIWDPATRERISTLRGHENGVRSIAWSPDGSRLASACHSTVRIWDPVTGQNVSTLPTASPYFLQFDKVNSNYLHTRYGTFDISSTPLPIRCGYGLSDDHSWITYNGLGVLWLPAEYRPRSGEYELRGVLDWSIYGTKLAIPLAFRVMFLLLSDRSPIPGF